MILYIIYVHNIYIYNLFVYINVLGTCVSVVVYVLVKMEEAFDTVVKKTREFLAVLLQEFCT